MVRKTTLLIANVVPHERDTLARLLRARDFGVVTARSTDHALKYLNEPIDLVIAERHARDSEDFELLRRWKKQRPAIPFIMVADDDNFSSAVEAMKLGATDFLEKPVEPEHLVKLVQACLEARREHEFASRRQKLREVRPTAGFDRIVGQSEQMLAVFDKIRQAARAESTVLITGESGTGKELVAEAIHRHSPRKDGPFLATNMAAVPDSLIESELFGHVHGAFTGAEQTRIGRFEAASGGTLFIDEIGDLKWTSQAKLLRVLENHRVTPVGGNEDKLVDVRVVAATNCSLKRMMTEEHFRQDLYYRLNVVTIALPPLRDRRDDIPLLIDFFIDQFCLASGYSRPQPSDELMQFFLEYDWPGNVRQLHNCIESMMVLAQSESLTSQDLPITIRQPNGRTNANGVRIPGGRTLEELEKLAILQTLDRCDGNRIRTAKQLGISVRTLQRKLDRWGRRNGKRVRV